MITLLLAVIYLAFISLGLPDSLLGSAWPVMYGAFEVPVAYAGIVSMIISGGTIISSLFSSKVINKFSTGPVTFVSVAMTALALFGFSFSTQFWQICLWGIPYGLGAGSVDAALNNYVALHFKSRHMSFLHCFWGIGATVGPAIMGLCLTHNFSWNTGYRTIGMIQVGLTVFIALSLPLWKKVKPVASVGSNDEEIKSVGMVTALRHKGVIAALITFFCYCSLESTTGLWASSYLVLKRGVDAQTAAHFASLFYLGITLGRGLSGFVSEKLGDNKMVWIGVGIIFAGLAVLIAPLPIPFALAALVTVGFGCAPIYPSLIHATPFLFGAEYSQTVIGMQMACAYTGTTFMPPLFGLISLGLGISVYPFFLLVFAVLLLSMRIFTLRPFGEAQRQEKM